jgi:hypothetical protein
MEVVSEGMNIGDESFGVLATEVRQGATADIGVVEGVLGEFDSVGAVAGRAGGSVVDGARLPPDLEAAGEDIFACGGLGASGKTSARN